MGSHVPGLLGYRCSRLHTEATSARRWHRATCSWLAATHTDNVIHARERGSGERWWGGTRYGHAHHRRSTGQRGMRHHAESASPSPQGTLTPLSTSPGHHRLEFQQVLPMFPVYSVTDVPGCTEPAVCSTACLPALTRPSHLPITDLHLGTACRRRSIVLEFGNQDHFVDDAVTKTVCMREEILVVVATDTSVQNEQRRIAKGKSLPTEAANCLFGDGVLVHLMSGFNDPDQARQVTVSSFRPRGRLPAAACIRKLDASTSSHFIREPPAGGVHPCTSNKGSPKRLIDSRPGCRESNTRDRLASQSRLRIPRGFQPSGGQARGVRAIRQTQGRRA